MNQLSAWKAHVHFHSDAFGMHGWAKGYQLFELFAQIQDWSLGCNLLHQDRQISDHGIHFPALLAYLPNYLMHSEGQLK